MRYVKFLLARALQVYARVVLFAGRFEEVKAALFEAERISNGGAALRIDLLETRAMLGTLGTDFASAVRFYEQLRNDHRALGNAKPECNAGYLVATDDLAGSATAAREVICERSSSDPEFHTVVANAMEHLALVFALRENTSALRVLPVMRA